MQGREGRKGDGRSTCLPPRFDNPGYGPLRGEKGRGRKGMEGKGRGGKGEEGEGGGKGPSLPIKKILALPLLNTSIFCRPTCNRRGSK